MRSIASAPAKATAADLDIRKARIVERLYPTRIHRGVRTEDQVRELAGRLGVSLRALYAWETGEKLPADNQVPVIEAWLAEGLVWRYAGIGRIVGPE